ncbi:kelch repeat-containing protein [Echinicola shivajiensis]|uniref:kelch repeat-containing protein n=1 Tax=Echinicola shivajiensis TaxID=1035916 RepID=UPI001BFC72B8|nr:kelch repeat-containing protein [Echinicola shivajiensis]
MDLTPDKPFEYSNGFDLEFEANFRQGDGHYGYIFRIISEDGTNIDLVSNLASTDANFWLVVKDSVIFNYKWNEIPEGGFDKWMPIKFTFSPTNSEVTLSINGKVKTKKNSPAKRLKSFKIIYGASKVPSFLNTDVCPMTLRNIQVINGNGKLDKNWKLGKHGIDKVYDEISYSEAVVSNPIWQIDEHIRWKNRTRLQFDNLIGITNDAEGNQVFFVTEEAVHRYMVSTDSLITYNVEWGNPFPCLGNTITYSPLQNQLLSYSFDGGELNIFDFESKTWDKSPNICNETDHWHHNKFFSSIDSVFYTFGGYGHYTYKSKLFKFFLEDSRLDSVELASEIPPRYLSALGKDRDREVLIFGGYGSKLGKQGINTEYFYDLYRLNLLDNQATKVWEMEKPSQPFVPTSSLIVDQDLGKFYTLIFNSSNYNTYLKLASFGLTEPSIEFYADSIPYKFLDTQSWSNVFLNPASRKLIALTSSRDGISILSQAYPPLLPSEVFQPSPKKWNYQYLLFGLLIIILMLAPLVFKLRSKKKKSKHSTPSILDKEKETPKKREKSAIYLLGGFQVYNKEGENITSQFTPTVKQLFLLILLYTVKYGKGISSVKLNEILWFDKTDSSARNNRNVNISKLRLLLEKIGPIELFGESNYWRIEIGPDVYCDYIETIHLLNQLNNSNISEKEILNIVHLLTKGDICPTIQSEWMDPFKVDFANKIVNELENCLKVVSEDHFHIMLADCMLNYDPLNEEAIMIKCSALCREGKKGLAKQSYDLFCKEYQTLLGIQYPISFNEFIPQK